MLLGITASAKAMPEHMTSVRAKPRGFVPQTYLTHINTIVSGDPPVHYYAPLLRFIANWKKHAFRTYVQVCKQVYLNTFKKVTSTFLMF